MRTHKNDFCFQSQLMKDFQIQSPQVFKLSKQKEKSNQISLRSSKILLRIDQRFRLSKSLNQKKFYKSFLIKTYFSQKVKKDFKININKQSQVINNNLKLISFSISLFNNFQLLTTRKIV
ncbi:hypothetical protein TTHERM_001107480 (macronuclear) [Tetrahymena thermophila SB210]|uniref:Uncharacterized protein n=1 Tax=Tetrahymena thermophila (strain SB210) TaxID=312017 RepID=W7X4B4_TETTS|nr:hypothetical protein TTHERM_001107480 [Tetrahymena thermophila SB210]EWS71248.1 hypothetical protein TTHERM_001107480 [Tetrahymena thermophila SB210]|eukprot:XP_012656221.1 hypothetical protein TTHERM_001107480 [Tetrahymena thermophila SB210]